MNRDHILFQIGRIHYLAESFLVRELEENGVSGLATSHGEIIGALLMQGTLAMNEISAVIGKDKSTVTALVKKLENLGYVRRSTSGEDGRSNLVSLTEKGAALKDVYRSISARLRKKAYRGFSESEKEILAGMLVRLRENMS